MTNWQKLASFISTQSSRRRLKFPTRFNKRVFHTLYLFKRRHSSPFPILPHRLPYSHRRHRKGRIIRFNLRQKLSFCVCARCGLFRLPAMVELGQTDTEVYGRKKTLQVWRTLLNWLAFFFQIFVQIIKATPSLINYSSSTSSSSSFEPLPVVELSESPEPPSPYAASAVHIPPADAAYDLSQKLTVVLDLDETLVCAYETSSLPAIVRNQAIDAGINWFELECLSSDKETEGKPKINYVTVFERPGLHEFLTQLSVFADLVLFTAGLEGYAKPLVDRIDAENRFSRRLYRPSTSSTEYREHVKDLSCISRNFCRIVIVDNNPFSFLLQPVNGIPCIPFSAGQPHDNQLLEVILPLLKQLSEQGDVRPVLYEKFHMPEWFHKHGIPIGWAAQG